MAKKKAKSPPFVMLRKDLLKDKDWKKLKSSSKILYIYMRAKYNNRTGSEITLAYSEISDMMSAATINRSFKELENKKFIIKTKKGGLYGGVCSYKFVGAFKDFYVKGQRV